MIQGADRLGASFDVVLLSLSEQSDCLWRVSGAADHQITPVWGHRDITSHHPSPVTTTSTTTTTTSCR
jgi:hypothetical protein